jgi:glycosyltransferase involved in cell wall biosynthesis
MSNLNQYDIVLLSNTYGGVLTYTKNLIKEVSRNHFTLRVYFIARSIEFQKNDFGKNVNFLTIANLVPNPLELFRFFSSNAHLIHANFAGVGILAVFLKFAFNIPFVLTLHGFPQPGSNGRIVEKFKYSIEKKLMHFVGSRASAIVVVSNYEKEMLTSNFGLKSEVIHNGIDLSLIKPFEKKWAKKEIGFRETDFVALFVGKLIPNKDPLTLIKSIKYASNKRENLRLVIVGTGELDEEIRSKTKKLELEDRVRFFGFIKKEKLSVCYSAADLFVLPSVNEPFGIVLLEAMAFGLPIIASDSGACPEVIGKAGVLFKQGNYKDLGEKIIKLMTDFRLRRQLADLGLKRVKQVFSIKENIQKHLNLYKRILKSNNTKCP